MIKTRQFSTKNEFSSQPANRKPTTIIPNPIAIATAHFIQPGMTSAPQIPSKFSASTALLAIHNCCERIGVQTRSTNQCAIQIQLRPQPLDVVRFDAAAV